ncbi:peptidylprolyl isomerase [Acuticoccus mangrovi]|uniref:Parvulin-like PPIase n=1 Tax=Acuticoccus mangrovi TaxID=2796142 RepID=A0A934MHV5_9HYPH|nr:peptidylprolyl isomerase [Acuticoccus mangrovi]MBJ3776501.1 SurA N-terminal domain-containing protein [Acuticoccus mangrovi]
MLNALRRGSKGIFAKILIIILVLSFAVWGISGFVNQVNPTEVARVGSTPVSAQDFARVYQAQANRLSQQLGSPITPSQAQAIGLPQQVLNSLVSEALQVDAAHALGVDLGDDTLASRIRENRAFAGPDGNFSRARFNRLMAENGYNEADFIELQRDAAAQEMWVNGVVGGVTAPTPYLEAFNRYANQTRRVTWFTVDDSMIDAIPDPDEDTLKAFYDEHQAEFRSPERRSFSTVTLSPEALAKPAEVSADAVRRAYEASGAYGTGERRHVQQIVLSDKALAEKAAAALNDGVAFAAILSELDRKFADVDLGLVERSALVDPAVADAAFSLDVKGAAAVDGRFGPVLVRVSEIVPAQKRPFEEVEGEIRQELALEEAHDQMRTLVANVEDAVAGGASVAEIGDRFDLPVATISYVSRQGFGEDGAPVDIPAKETVLTEAFSDAPGDDASPVEDGDATIWVQVDSVKEAADQPFEKVEGDVRFAWTEAEKAKRIEAVAEEAEKKVREGASVEEVAAEYGAEAQVSEPFSQGKPPEGLPQPASAAAFEGPLGHVDLVMTGDFAQVVLKVTEVNEPAFFEGAADLQQIRRALDDGMGTALLLGFLNGWQQEVGATQNPTVINSIVGLDRAGS